MLATLLAGCNNIPDVADPHHITVDGKPMKQKDFLHQYCQGQLVQPTCAAVAQAMVRDATRSKMPAGW